MTKYTEEYLRNYMDECEINFIIPMSGRGQRFKDAGYSKPKPFIDVNGQPMIQRVINNITPNLYDISLWCVCLDSHLDYFKDVKEDYGELVVTDGVTQGAACSVLLACDRIKEFDKKYNAKALDRPLIIANSDQLIDWPTGNIDDFIFEMRYQNAGGAIAMFKAYDRNPKWSFALTRLAPQGEIVSLVREKKPISDSATCGVYAFSSTRRFIAAAEKMIKENDRHNNEFYLAPVYNHYIEMFGSYAPVLAYYVNGMQGLGTPEDLTNYLAGRPKKKNRGVWDYAK